MKTVLLGSVTALAITLACSHAPVASEARPAPASPVPPASVVAPAPPPRYDQVERTAFNRIAADLALPIFWRTDANQNRRIDPDEIAVYWGLDPAKTLGDYVQMGAFTPAFDEAYAEIARWREGGPWMPAEGSPEERTRRELIVKELEQSRPTLVETDPRQAPENQQAFVKAILAVSSEIDRLYAKQLGVLALRSRVASDDSASHTAFWRNHGYRCLSPKTKLNPGCSAIPNPPKGKVSGLYPQAPLQDPGFCESLGKDKALIDPFSVVEQGADGALVAVPYSKAFAEEMGQISKLLLEAAAALPTGEEEPLKAYLRADAQAFLDDQWTPADEAWAKMNATNSRWYLRVAPDETYAEPCSTKALFQVSFGLIDQGALHWQQVLSPRQSEMERAIAKLAGPPYQARKVTFHLPDFFSVAINAGDARSPTGATVGESLPNFGPVANEGRGRTVAMTNFYTDPDSLAAEQANAESLLCQDTMAHFTTSPEPGRMSVVLHEATHNLGPAAQYAVQGKIDVVAFGGPLASMLEELKAQSGALYFTDWLVQQHLISAEDANRSHVAELLWIFGQMSRGMFDAEHHPLAYSQLAAMQLGFLMRAGAVSWRPEEVAANGKDHGCFSVDMARFQAADVQMLKKVAGIKARADRPAAEAWVKEDVEVSGPRAQIRQAIDERILRTPRATFVYDVELR